MTGLIRRKTFPVENNDVLCEEVSVQEEAVRFHVGKMDWYGVYVLSEMGVECDLEARRLQQLQKRAKVARDNFLSVQAELYELYKKGKEK